MRQEWTVPAARIRYESRRMTMDLHATGESVRATCAPERSVWCAWRACRRALRTHACCQLHAKPHAKHIPDVIVSRCEVIVPVPASRTVPACMSAICGVR